MSETVPKKDFMLAVQCLRELYQNTGIIDNGTCAVCGAHRTWRQDSRSGRSKPTKCENPDCLTHDIEAVLRRASR